MKIRRTVYAVFLETIMIIVLNYVIYKICTFNINNSSEEISLSFIIILLIMDVMISGVIMEIYLCIFPRIICLEQKCVIFYSLFRSRKVDIENITEINILGAGTLANMSGSTTYVIRFDNKKIILNATRYKDFKEFKLRLDKLRSVISSII